MKTITYNVYDFDELSESAKEKAVEKLYDINVDYEWYDYIYEDAKRIGLKIESFDIDRGLYCKMIWIDDFLTVTTKIKKEHGKKCESYKTACQYLKEWKKEKDEDKKQGIEDDFLKSISEDYRIMLQKEYEYNTSKEAIIKTIKANEYTFDENGNIDNG